MADKAPIIRALVLLDSKPDDVLEHYGVMGMHWGVRRSRSSGGGRLRSTPKSARGKMEEVEKKLSDHQRAIELRRRGVKNLTTAELKELTNRLQLEKTYKQMMPKGKLANAEAILKRTVDLGGTLERAYTLANSEAGRKLRKHVESQLKHTPKVVK